MKSKAQKKQEWTYKHTMEIIQLNEALLARMAEEAKAAEADRAAATPPIGLGPFVLKPFCVNF